MSWDYSDLSHQAKQGGGPEKFIKNLEKFNYDNGLREGKAEQAKFDLMIAGTCAGFWALYKSIQIIRNRIEKAKEPKISTAQAEESRQQLIRGIKYSEAEESITNIIMEDQEKNGENGKMC